MRARLAQLTARLDEAGLGVGGPGPLVGLTVLAVLRAVALVVIAESIAIGVTALADGTEAWRSAASFGAAAVLARAALGWAAQTVAARLAIRSTQRLRRDVVERALEAPGEASGGTVVLATSGLDELDAYYRQVVPAAVSAAVVPLVIGLRILGTDWLSALIVALTLPLVPLFMALIGMHTRDQVDRATGALERLGDHLVELARGLPVLVGLGRVAEQTRALARIQDDYRERTLATLRVAFLSALALELIGTISVALVAVAIGLRLVEGQLGLEVGLAVLILAPEVYAAVREVGVAFHAAQGGLGALRRAREVVRQPAVAGWRRVDDRLPAAHVDALRVRYAGREDAAVSDLTADFAPGTITALTGPSGAGKSTVLAALVGALSADAEVQGTVRVPRGPIAYAAQSPRLVAASPRDELALTSASAQEIERMLAVLDLSAVEGRHPALLSPGERRRVAVARALLLAPAAALVVLDEPTAHLDAAHAELVRLEIRRLRTAAPIVLVSHEPETVALADIRIPIAPSAVADPPAVVRFSGEFADAGPAAPVVSAHRAETSGETTHSEPSSASAAQTEPARMPILARAALAILLGLAATGFGMALSAVSGWLIVRASEQPDLMYLLVAIVGVRFFGIGRAVARYTERLVTHDAVFRASDALRLRVWHAIAARGAASARLREGGTAVDYLVTLVHEVRDLAPRVISPLLIGVLSVVGVVITTAFVLPELTFVVAATLVAGVGIAVLVTALADRRGAGPRLEARTAHTAALAALLRGADEVRAAGIAPAALAELDRLAERSSQLARRAARAEGAGAAVAVVALVGLAVMVPTIAAPLVAAGATSAPTVAVIALLALATLDPALALVEATRLSPRLSASWRRLSALRVPMEAPAPAATPATARTSVPAAAPAADAPHPAVAPRGLTLTSLAARWPGTDSLVFDGITAQVGRGEWLQVSGPSGAGKSTLLTVLLGGLSPASGAVSLDGAPLVAPGDADAEGRRQVAWCPQDALLFSSTVRANLRIARPRGHEPNDADIRETLERVGLGRLLASMPAGLDTRVGSGGAALSGGERQRLAVARALLTDAEVVLLDEPTAHLDAEGAAALMADLRRATSDRIVVLVSHRAADAAAGDARILLGDASSGVPVEPTSPRFEPLATVR
ncbi:thiol reductant ABC exporter subunit CydC [uncultured Schumannella sp.]|uniref:thiol reductant ABC exporter subunit CydC n=1 Tax=uncultured Schumannella sp. TaxID=1195956 RepID=UPI0025DE86CB|nr:thiol reductant ABC exporter subunit CydC [uncultured Schumannella sp.]